MRISNYFKMGFLFLSILFLLPACAVKKEVNNTSTEAAFNPKDYPLILRRTTLIVRDMDKALALYRDAMGMEVIYDNIIKRKNPNGEGEQQIKLIFLKSIHQYYGVLGLVDYHYEDPAKKIIPISKEGFSAGKMVLLFNTNDLEAGFQKIKNTPGVEIITAPAIRKYPSYDGKSIIRVMVCTFYDPDGFLVEYNQLIDDL